MQQQADGSDGTHGRDGRDTHQEWMATRLERGLEQSLKSARVPRLETVSSHKTFQMTSTQDISGQSLPNSIPNLTPNSIFDRRSTSNNHPAETLGGLIHDARNMVSAIDLYCDLLEEPGVLSVAFRHYAEELRLVGGASRRLLEKLAVLEGSTAHEKISSINNSFQPASESISPSHQLSGYAAGPHFSVATGSSPIAAASNSLFRPGRRQLFPTGQPIESLPEELMANRSLLSALVGPAVTIGLTVPSCRYSIAMTGDDLTRVLVNLARNAAEAMPDGGHIQIALEEGQDHLCLTIADNGPGIPEAALEDIFSAGYTTHIGLGTRPETKAASASGAWPVRHRGLGLAIVRSIVSAAGGSVWAANRTDDLSHGSTGLSANTTMSAIHLAREEDRPDPETHEIKACKGAIFLLEFPLLNS